MKMTKTLLVIFVIGCSSISPTSADEIFNNGLDLNNADFWSYSFSSTSTGHQFQIADDFSFVSPPPDSWVVDGARWTGAFIDGGEYQPLVSSQFDFDIMLFADNGGRPTGRPIDPVPGTAIAHRFVSGVTGVFPTGSPYGDFVAQYDVSFDPITLDRFTNYWLVVAARGDFTFQEINNPSGSGWLWTGRNGTGNGWQGGTDFRDDWFFQARQQDFSLFGRQIPEPSSTVLLGVCLIGGWMRRRL